MSSSRLTALLGKWKRIYLFHPNISRRIIISANLSLHNIFIFYMQKNMSWMSRNLINSGPQKRIFFHIENCFLKIRCIYPPALCPSAGITSVTGSLHTLHLFLFHSVFCIQHRIFLCQNITQIHQFLIQDTCTNGGSIPEILVSIGRKQMNVRKRASFKSVYDQKNARFPNSGA